MTCNFVILYASQKGTAKDIAEDIYCESFKYDLNPSIYCISEVDKAIFLENTFCIILVGATTGEGEPPDTAVHFWNILHKKSNCNISNLSHLSYTILGLGDSNYVNFCNFGKTVDHKLYELGAKRFYECGWADDEIGLEVVVEPWIEGLFPTLKSFCTNYPNFSINRDTSVLPLSEVSYCGNCDIALTSINEITNTYFEVGSVSVIKENCTAINFINDARFELLKKPLFSLDKKLSLPVLSPHYLNIKYLDEVSRDDEVLSNYFSAEIIGARRLTSVGSLKQTVEIKLKFPSNVSSEELKPGDSFCILPTNTEEEVLLLICLLGLEKVANLKYELSVNHNSEKRNPSVPKHIPIQGTIRNTFLKYIDIRCIPRKSFIRTLSEYTSNPEEKRRLKELSSKEGSEFYKTFILNNNFSFIDLLLVFNSCRPSITTLLEHMPKLQPRYYSICSYPLVKNYVAFAFNVIEFSAEQILAYSRKGLCTGMMEKIVSKHIKANDDNIESLLNSLSLNDHNFQLTVALQKPAAFRMIEDLSKPLIMVGPGTGIAPFISFLECREYLLNKCSGTCNAGESWLFFGCREQKDFLFRNELQEFVNKKVLSHLSVCFSRVTNGPKYVQEKIKENAEALVHAIKNNNGHIYVCGDAKNMAKDVFDAFSEVLSKSCNIGLEESLKYLVDMKLNGRYLQDVWT